MAAPGLMSWELWEACSGPSSRQRRLSPTPATGRQDSLEGAPSLPQGPRPSWSLGSILFLSDSVQEPVRRPQNVEFGVGK